MTDRTADYEATNREFWDRDADDYQEVHESQLSATDGRWGVWAIPESDIEALGDVSGLDVLELGCGGAQHANGVARDARRRVGLDQSVAQLGHAVANLERAELRMPLVCASATATPFRDESFDVVFCDHGAMSFCDPYATVPEASRLLRPDGLLVFNCSTLFRNLCFPTDDPDALITRTLHSAYFGARAFDWGDGTIDFQIPHGEWIRLFAAHGLVVEDLIELQPPPAAETTFPDFADLSWARSWPGEEIWRVRKISVGRR